MKHSPGTPSHKIIPCPGSFKQVSSVTQARVRVADVELVIPELTGKSAGKIRFYEAGLSLAKDKIPRPNVD
jgi:hypothetical protein